MRSRSTRALVALVAVFAMSAVTTAVASAAKPEFNPMPAKKKFTGSGSTSTWALGGERIFCTKSSTTGEVTSGDTVGDLIMSYTGCTSTNVKKETCPANSDGAKAGEIVTLPLDGELGTVAIKEAASGVGLRFKPANKYEEWFVLQKNNCTAEKVFSGSLAVEVSVIDKKQATNKLVFASGGSGGEKITKITLDSGVVEKPVLEASGATASIEAATELKFEEAMEVT